MMLMTRVQDSVPFGPRFFKHVVGMTKTILVRPFSVTSEERLVKYNGHCARWM